MATPAWLAAVAGQAANSGQINQFLGTHAATFCYAATQKAAQNTAGSGGTSSLSTWIAQSFTTAVGQTTVGRVVLTLAITGSPAPLTVALYANSGSAPTGGALVTTLVPREFLSGSPTSLSIPLPVTGLTASTTYWIVTQAVGTGGNIFTWSKSNQVSGTSTSSNGTSWSAQGYGSLYQVYDQSTAYPLMHTWEDSGARWTSLGYTSNQLTSLNEYTVGQTATGYLASVRTLTYTGTTLTGVS